MSVTSYKVVEVGDRVVEDGDKVVEVRYRVVEVGDKVVHVSYRVIEVGDMVVDKYDQWWYRNERC